MTDALGDDTNQFGPGTDLIVSLLAVVLVISLITSHLYRAEQARVVQLQQAADAAKPKASDAASGNFKLASEFFTAADFHPRPVTRLVDTQSAAARIERIARDYHDNAAEYPYVFVIGHSNQLDDPDAEDQSVQARRRRNMEYGFRRAALITSLLQEHLSEDAQGRVVAVSTGEFDLKDSLHPTSGENAWVEVVFGREWKLPGRKSAH
ncbi:MAG TPA: hypothetical protein VKB93_28500 [Thermoanaerobaculia bacterium]|nr:hypothetical protein [Thermoanaerobaculia bacterium]